jgi:predicted nucleic acid-binding protein
MVIVDSSVWIDLLKDRETAATQAFDEIAAREKIALGDLILYEVLQGVMPAERTDKVKQYLLRYHMFTMGGRDLILEAVHNSHALRAKGFQPGTVDCLIATLCMITGSKLLTSDHHFQPFVDILGLELVG